MSKTFHLAFAFLGAISLTAQTPPSIDWQRCIGGTETDLGFDVVQMGDGSIIVAGNTYSTNGNISGNHGWSDGLVVKFSAEGSVIWLRVLGGSNFDHLYSIEKTPDGGVVLAGMSSSNDGDVSGGHGGIDGWVVKLDASGTLVWQKCIGGTANDYAREVVVTDDGGILVSVEVFSDDGDVDENQGNADVLIMKLDASGVTQWTRTYGGSDWEQVPSLVPSSDGGCYVLSTAAVADGDVTSIIGNGDFWLLKLDAQGDLEWERCLGGSSIEEAWAIASTPSGGVIVVGETFSNDVDVSGNHGIADYWVAKLDAVGDIIWQTCMGGSAWDRAITVATVPNGGYVVAGRTQSNDGDVSGYHGGNDAWVVRLSEEGFIEWQRALGGSLNDEVWGIDVALDGGILLACKAESLDGDVVGQHGAYDMWVMKLREHHVGIEDQGTDPLLFALDLDRRVLSIQSSETAYYSILDVQGRELHRTGSVQASHELSLAEFSNGVYLLMMHWDEVRICRRFVLDR